MTEPDAHRPSESDRDSDSPELDFLRKIREELTAWWPIVVGVSTVITSLLATILPEDRWAEPWGYLVTLGLAAVTAWIAYRQISKRRLRRRRRQKLAADVQGIRTAFRGLYAFEVKDKLPGEHRRREARMLFTQLTTDDVRFRVICGESGCGKTSLLRSSLRQLLEEEGFQVIMVRHAKEIDSAGQGSPAASLEEYIARFRDLVSSVEPDHRERTAVILDQFEELLAQFAQPTERSILGASLATMLAEDPGLRIICAIRSVDLLDLHDLAPGLSEPTSTRKLFRLRNFMTQQAKAVLLECAELDGIECTDEFAELVATDLTERGEVRPVELQLVCTALAGNLTSDTYRLSGGAVGIISNYISNIANDSSHPALARRVLRTLCDFPTHAKTDPKTSVEIADEIGSAGEGERGKQIRFVDAFINLLEESRLVLRHEGEQGPAKFQLVHDYVVDAIQIATKDDLTRREEARQLLEEYKSQARRFKGVTIPLVKLWFLKQHAVGELWSDKAVKRLVLRSLLKRTVLPTMLTLFLVAVFAAVIVQIGSQSCWQIDNKHSFSHWDLGQPGSVRFAESVNGVVTIPWDSQGQLRTWRATTGELIDILELQEFHRIGQWVIGLDKNNIVRLRSLEDGTEEATPLPPAVVKSFGGNAFVDEDLVIWTDQVSVVPPQGRVVVWSRDLSREIAKFDTLEPTARIIARVEDLVVMWEEYDVAVVRLSSGDPVIEKLGEFTAAEVYGTWLFGLKPESRQDSDGSARSTTVSLFRWDLASESLESERVWNSGEEEDLTEELDYLNIVIDELLVALVDHDPFAETDVVKAWRLPNMQEVPELSKRRSVLFGGPPLPFVIKDQRSGAMFWSTATGKSIKINRLSFDPETSRIDWSASGARLLLKREDGSLELWDALEGKSIRSWSPSERIQSSGFTLDKSTLFVRPEGGNLWLYATDDGELIGELDSPGGNRHLVFFDDQCRSALVWTSEGRVLKYVDGTEYFRNKDWFRPTRDQANCRLADGQADAVTALDPDRSLQGKANRLN